MPTDRPDPRRRLVAVSLPAAAGVLSLGAARPVRAQARLDGPLRLVVGYAPGGGTDRAARLLAEALKDRLGVPVIVENKTGAGGRIAAQNVRAAAAGQNVLLVGNPAINVVAPMVFANVGYDPKKDFVPVAQLTRYDFCVAVGAAVPVRELSHLIAWLRANPEKANFGVPATGSLPHFFALMIADAAKVKAQVVGYRGSAPLSADLIGGQIPVAVDTLDTTWKLHEAGKVRVLATGAARRSADTHDLPTLKEAGFDVVAEGWNTFFAPASMPAAKVALIGRAIEASMKQPALQAKFRTASMTPVAGGPEQAAKAVAAFRAKWEPVVKASGIRN